VNSSSSFTSHPMARSLSDVNAKQHFLLKSKW
jgi:hypothetical protein